MDITGYISEVTNVRSFPSDIDDTDEYFLFLILNKGLTSAYQIFSRLKAENTHMAYKNVHRRIRNLFESNLIEEIKTEGGFKHGARNYKLTTRGLVYLFSELGAPYSSNILLSYMDNILFTTFVDPCFERRTIRSATYSLSRLIENYLEECCRMTRYALEWMVDYSYPDMQPRELLETAPIEVLRYQLNWHIRSFILKTTMMKDNFIDWRQWTGRPLGSRTLHCIANDRMDTFLLLSQDRKFVRAAEEIKEQFSEGFSKLVDFKKNKSK
jgi:hypothetical protein